MDKKELRRLYKSVRKSIMPKDKSDFDKRIFTSLINSPIYQKSKSLMIYVSFNDEADTINIIRYALSDGRIVAVPYCNGTDMEFLVINSLDDLSEGEFGIPTANPEKNHVFNDFKDALCIVPGLSFDIFGNRLGYGGGFYDRFLINKDVVTLGITYERCLSERLQNEEHDVRIDYILTEKCLRNSKEEVST